MQYLYGDDPSYSGPEPFTYRLHAWHFLMCAEYALDGCQQATGKEPSPMLNVPIIHLICHAIEMLLKLGLYKSGAKESDLRDISIRHNLTELRKRCEERGVRFSADCTALIEALSPIHVDHRLRYTAFQDPPHWLPFKPREMIDISRGLIGVSHPEQSA